MDTMNRNVSRRRFVGALGAIGIGGVGLGVYQSTGSSQLFRAGSLDDDEPGTWATHCHVLMHAEGPHGMFGMVTAMIVEE